MKKLLITVLQIAVTAFALYWVFKKPGSFTDTVHTVRAANPLWLLAALAAGSFSPITATIRWWLLLRVQNLGVSFGRVVYLYLVGMFFNLFLPGSTGGDAVKLFYLLRGSDRSRRAGIILSVIMDRLLGLLALILLATVFVGLRYHWLMQTADVAKMVHGFVTLLALAVGGIAIVFAAVQLRLVDRLPAGMPGRSKFVELAVAVQLYTKAWPTVLLGICISMIGHSSFIFTYYFAARAVRATVSLVDMAVLVPIVNTIVSLPVSLSGVGVREGLFKTLLHDLCSVGEQQAVPISIIGFLCTVIFYGLVVGGAVYLLYRSAEGAAPTDVQAQEAAMEAAELPGIAEQVKKER